MKADHSSLFSQERLQPSWFLFCISWVALKGKGFVLLCFHLPVNLPSRHTGQFSISVDVYDIITVK